MGILVFWAGITVWGIYDHPSPATTVAADMTFLVFALVAAAFGMDAALKQGK